jgi:ComF family protein
MKAMKRIFSLFSLIREYIFPAQCGVCQKTLFRKEEAFYGLCADCAGAFFIEKIEKIEKKEPRCSRCGDVLISEIGVCSVCVRNPLSYLDYILPLFPYAGAYRSLLTAYKFKKQKNIGNFLAEKLFEGIVMLKELKKIDEELVLVPVPPRYKKIKREGWDQVEYLARIIEKLKKNEKKFSVRRCLKRLPSQEQKELNRQERQINLLRRIECSAEPPKVAVLFDDVITTGSTMEACASALKQAGSVKVYGVCLFHA